MYCTNKCNYLNLANILKIVPKYSKQAQNNLKVVHNYLKERFETSWKLQEAKIT